MDAFMSAIFGAKSVKATARQKLDNQTRTVTLHAIPNDTTEEAFVEAAKTGIDLSVRVVNGDRARNISGKGVFGAAATSATASVLGFTASESVPDSVKRRGRPSLNGTPETASKE
jgi:hypothetical protein